MTQQSEKSNDELMMEQLCKDLASFLEQKEIAVRNKVNAELGTCRMSALIMISLKEIAELERKGIKKVEVKPADIKTPEQQQAKPQGDKIGGQ